MEPQNVAELLAVTVDRAALWGVRPRSTMIRTKDPDSLQVEGG
ncbi:hypothetical protein ACWD6R_04145 [Streptomyces sp. NPDC005151]